MLEQWTAALAKELGITEPIDVEGLLELTRVVAHGVARPAAPLTALLVGLAAARDGGTPAAVAAASTKARALAEHWPADHL